MIAAEICGPQFHYNPIAIRDNGLIRINGFGFNWGPKGFCFCAHAILMRQIDRFIVSSSRNDERFSLTIH